MIVMRGCAGECANSDEERAEHRPDRATERMNRAGRCGEKADTCTNDGASKLGRDDPATMAGKEAAGYCAEQPADNATDHHAIRTNRVTND